MPQDYTLETFSEYLENDGALCPFCNSDNIEPRDSFEGTKQKMTCLDCNEDWSDIYQLVGIDYDGDEYIRATARHIS